MNRRELVGVGVAACVACCIGPILGVLGGIGALGLVSAVFIGAAGIVVAVVAAMVLVGRRRAQSCATDVVVPVELTSRP